MQVPRGVAGARTGLLSGRSEAERDAMSDPFKLFGRLILAGFKIAGYLFTGTAETLWYIAHGRRDLLGQVIGDFGRSVTNAVAKVFSD